MPAARQRSRSPVIACAVIATIGTCAPVSRSRSRMAAVASRPPISGIWTSMRIASNGFSDGLRDRLLPVRHGDDAVPALIEQRDDELLVGRVVFGDEDAQRALPARRAGRARRRGMARATVARRKAS